MPDEHNFPIEVDLVRSSDGSTNVDLESAKVPSGQRWFIQRATMADETTALTRVRLGFRSKSGLRFIEDEDLPAAAELVQFNVMIALEENESLIGRFVGSTSADVLRLHARGFGRRVK